MKLKFLINTLFLLLIFNFNTYGIDVKVLSKLSPAGTFELECSNVISTFVKKVKNSLFIKQAKIEVTCLDSGIELRNEHVYKYLKSDKFPYLIMNDIKVLDKNASAQVTIGDKTVHEKLLFESDDKRFTFKFNIDLKKYSLETPSFMGVTVNNILSVEIKGSAAEIKEKE